MKKVLMPTFACLVLGAADALTLTGQMTSQAAGTAPGGKLLVSMWAVQPSGERGELLGMAQVEGGGGWSLGLGAAPASATALNAGNIAWPGVLPPAALSAPAKAAEARAYAFVDTNGNGTLDASEGPLREVALGQKGADAFVVWVSAPTQVSAGKGYKADLSEGWNLLGVRLGKAIEVQPLTGTLEMRVRP